MITTLFLDVKVGYSSDFFTFLAGVLKMKLMLTQHSTKLQLKLQLKLSLAIFQAQTLLKLYFMSCIFCNKEKTFLPSLLLFRILVWLRTQIYFWLIIEGRFLGWTTRTRTTITIIISTIWHNFDQTLKAGFLENNKNNVTIYNNNNKNKKNNNNKQKQRYLSNYWRKFDQTIMDPILTIFQR